MPNGPSDHVTALFVYGTLRRDARPLPISPLCRGWVFKGYGSVEGELYDFGAYPGAVPPPTPGGGRESGPLGARVRGEIYELPDPTGMLPLVDRYEGCGPEHLPPHEFERERVEVALDDGGVVEAWIYWYRPIPRGRRLVSGDYVERTGSG